ncbi:hypothetical protein Q7500_09740 [Glaesserella parasuis]|nr:hypothetical protein [Glaesserella parasuis]MDO9808580.1 hypothetical protein [Glaesserella parasuis]MDO9817330.1 hypothetical protein [Glaesserella parasuis]MDO9821523.1 hypothetical protein [Glaesserella parasuis]MDO9823597.1 hypothetical protein [Glaesserella parasuis]
MQNNTQRYFCNECYKTFILKSKLDPIKIWTDYTSGKQTYQQLAEKYHCSVRTIQRYIDKAPKTALRPPLNRYLNVIMDTLPNNVISHYFLRTEKDIYYKLALNRLREKGYFPYKHRNVRSAYTSLKRYMDFIFIYEKHSELNIEKTTNLLGGFFK